MSGADILVGFIVCAVAVAAVLELWFEGSVFEPARLWLQKDAAGDKGHFFTLLSCPLCLSQWISWFIGCAWWGPPLEEKKIYLSWCLILMPAAGVAGYYLYAVFHRYVDDRTGKSAFANTPISEVSETIE